VTRTLKAKGKRGTDVMAGGGHRARRNHPGALSAGFSRGAKELRLARVAGAGAMGTDGAAIYRHKEIVRPAESALSFEA